MGTGLTLVRGIPGSGKSTLAKKLALAGGAVHLETDMYFIDSKTGLYTFKRENINGAHSWCLDAASRALHKGANVVVSNTFVQMWEMRPYIALAEETDSSLQIIEVTGKWTSIHKVPEEVIVKMIAKWEPIDRSQINGWEW